MENLNKTKEWMKILKESIQFSVLTKTLPSKGNLAYEYNPFRNYRLTKDMYEYKDKLWTLTELAAKYGICLDTDGEWKDQYGKDWPDNDLPITRLKGELVDFITDELKFSLENPVHIIPQYSYDGSVNLILNDGINLPRMINSRFSTTGKDTYEIVDRKGGNDTNIYDQGELFETDVSLYKRVKTIPQLKLKGVSYGGLLHCGNYHFYFKLADADGNETDFIAESGLVSLFIGRGAPVAIYSGNKNENTYKKVNFQLSDIDPSYSYVYVYYSRATAEDGENKVIEYKKISKKYLINNLKISNILITGTEDLITISATDINLSYNVVDSAKSSTTAKSMLFLGNVHKPTEDYETLTDLSLRFLPYLKDTVYPLNMNETYSISSTSKGYYDPVFIYNYVGYWDKDLYRLGIVYILDNGELTSVYNIRGKLNISTFKAATQGAFVGNSVNDGTYNEYFFYKKSGSLDTEEEVKIKSSESTNYLISPEKEEGYEGSESSINYENSKGIVSVNSDNDTNIIHAFEIRVSYEVMLRLKDLNIQGFFFVRLGRLPLTLCQGITVGLDSVSRTPTIPTQGGILTTLTSELKENNNYVETADISKTNYVSEGFLSRFKFELKRTTSSIWSLIGKVAGMVVAIAGMVAASILSFGAATPAAGVGIAAIIGTSGVALLGGTALATAIVTVGVAVAAGIVTATTMAFIAGTEELTNAIDRAGVTIELKGRNTAIPSGFYRSELEESRLLGESFSKRLIIKDYTKNTVSGILCPDYDVAPQIYNLYFTGNDFTIITSKSLAVNLKFIDYYRSSNHMEFGYYFTNNDRHFYIPMNAYATTRLTTYTSRIQAVPDDTALITIGTATFRSRAGNSEEAWRYQCIGTDYLSELSYNSDEEDDDDEDEPSYKETNSDIIRGSFGPYLGMDGYTGYVGETISIMVPGYTDALIEEYILIRMQDSSPYYAISDRISLQNLDNYYQNKSGLVGDSTQNLDCQFTLYRGDCYICQFTHRLNRNFNDPSAPYNDIIVDSKSWKSNYKVNDSGKFSKINLGDVNAVKLGMWVTFTVRSNRNLNIRSLDSTSTEEVAKMGHPKGFYPYQGMLDSGSFKSQEALVYNAGFTQNLSARINFTLPDSPYNINWYGTRIMYSDIQVNDGISNGFRIFQGLNYEDYTREYGEIVKLLNYNDDLLVIFEHGVALIPINERAVAASSSGGDVYINTSKVLPKTPNIISSTFGSIWPDSVILVPPIASSMFGSGSGSTSPLVFGVDTVAKKIWCYMGGSLLTVISDFRVQEFLNQNLTFTQRENTPLLGIRNVKTAYNAFKHDIMFTFYDDLNTTSEKVWNLCYNILLRLFTTFYSWVPSFMENINNVPFSFDRTISKWISKLGQSHANNSFASGIVLSNNIYNNDFSTDADPYVSIKYLTKFGEYATYCWPTNAKKVSTEQQALIDTAKSAGLVGYLGIESAILPEGEKIQCYAQFELLRDIYGYYKNFEVKKVLDVTLPTDAKYHEITIPVYGLFFNPELELLDKTLAEYVGEKVKESDSDAPTFDLSEVYDENGETFLIYDEELAVKDALAKEKEHYFTELYYRNYANRETNDFDDYKVTKLEIDAEHCTIPLEYVKLFGLEEFLTDSEEENEKGGLILTTKNYFQVMHKALFPIFHNRAGNRVPLPTNINKNSLVLILNIKASIFARFTSVKESLNEANLAEYLKYLKTKSAGTKDSAINASGWISAGSYTSSIAITSKWNFKFLDSSFWRHGQAGVFDITEDILPTKWYGEQHPFEFEVIVADNPSMLKVFKNLEICSNKAKPESFHFEIVGESYDFAKDKLNMYFRQEARRALFLYNGADIEYNSNFLKLSPKQQPKSAELIYNYYERLDTIEDIYDSYVGNAINSTDYSTLNSYLYEYNSWAKLTPNKDYRHLSGAEIVYYPTRQEYRIWQHLPAIDIDDLSLDTATSIIRANCLYLEDRWRVSINPLLITYKNEYTRNKPGALVLKDNSTWAYAMDAKGAQSTTMLPPITIRNTSIPKIIKEKDFIQFPSLDELNNSDNSNALEKLVPKNDSGEENALKGLYFFPDNSIEHLPIDTTNWLDDVNIYKTSFGEAQNRKETNLRDKFIKVRIRYSGEELAVIQFLNTIYSISYA